MKTSTIKGEDKLTQQVSLSRKAHFCALRGPGSRGTAWCGLGAPVRSVPVVDGGDQTA
jgi:hypothetical protein